MDCAKGLTKTTHNYPVNKHENNVTGQDNDLTKTTRSWQVNSHKINIMDCDNDQNM